MNTDLTPTLLMELLLKHILETGLQQQQVTQELARGLQGSTQELHTQCATSRAANPRQEAQHLLHNLNPDDDVKAYLCTFEQMASCKLWPDVEWAQIVAPLFTCKAQLAFCVLSPVTADDCNLLKAESMACCGLSPSQAEPEFHQWTYRADLTPQSQMAILLCLIKWWLQPEQHSTMQVTEWDAMDWALGSLPPDECLTVSMRAWMVGYALQTPPISQKLKCHCPRPH